MTGSLHKALGKGWEERENWGRETAKGGERFTSFILTKSGEHDVYVVLLPARVEKHRHTQNALPLEEVSHMYTCNETHRWGNLQILLKCTTAKYNGCGCGSLWESMVKYSVA